MNEQELVSRAQSGDFEAFTGLVKAHKAKIYALALKLTGNNEDAEDIVSETFLRSIDKIDKFRGESSFGTWLYSIALNLARAQFAKRSQVELKDIEEFLPSHDHVTDSGTVASALFDWRDPHQQLEAAQLRSQINEALAKLPYKYREAFILRYFEELSVKEVSAMIGESVASTKSRILRARLALRETLTKSFEESYGQRLS